MKMDADYIELNYQLLTKMNKEDISSQILSCKECQKKQLLISKYLRLIDLLKKKNQKNLKHQVQRHPNLFQMHQNLTKQKQNIYTFPNPYVKPIQPINKNLQKVNHYSKTHSNLILPLLIVSNKIKKLYFSKSFQKLLMNMHMKYQDCFSKTQFIKLQKLQQQKQSLQFPDNILNIIQYIKKVSQPIKSTIYKIDSLKQMLKNNFKLLTINQALKIKLSKVVCDLEQNIRKQNKQNQKKRQSLQMFGEQLVQKNQLISELKTIIKSYQVRISLNPNILQDQVQTIKIQLDRLQRVNEKHNSQAEKNLLEKKKLNDRVTYLQKQIIAIKEQNQLLRQTLFDLRQNQSINKQLKSDLQSSINVLKNKIQKIKKQEKKINLMSRNLSQIYKLAENDLCTRIQIKKVITTISSQTNLTMKSNMCLSQDGIDLQTKLNSLFIFLKNIKNHKNDLLNKNLFTDSEIKIIDTLVKNFCINQTFSKIQSRKEQFKTINLKLNNENYAEKQDLFLLKNTNVNSILDVIDNPAPKTANNRNQLKQSYTIKLIQLQIEKNSLVEKISELKNKIMHIRNILFNLLKSLKLKNLNQQSIGILDIIFDVFEYSEDQKMTIFKKKKSFGFFQ